MKKLRVLLPIVLIFVLILTLTLFACKPEPQPEPQPGPNALDEVVTKDAPAIVYPNYAGGDTLVVGYSYFSNKFSPFFSKTAYDSDVAGMTQVGLITTDRVGAVVMNGIEGETRAYNGKDYVYKGIANVEVTQTTEGPVYYDFEIRDDLFFSDGVHLTIDDVIFTMYVLSDPTYDGSSSFYALPIKGMNDYRTGVTSDVYDAFEAKADAILAAGKDGAVTDAFTAEQKDVFFGSAFDAAGIKFAQEIVDYVFNNYNSAPYEPYMGPLTVQSISGNEGLQMAYGMRMWGFGGWTYKYPEAENGTYGKIDEEVITLYVADASAEKPAFTVADVKYVEATNETASDDLVYISEKNEDGEATAVAAYSGTRFGREFDGGFKDSMGTVFNLDTEFPTIETYWANLKNAYGYDVAEMQLESAGADLATLIKNEFIRSEGPKAMTGGAVMNIAGIQKTGNYTMRIEMTKFDAPAIYQLGVSVTPLHYYGSRDAYKYSENKFGFTKGDLSSVRAKTTSPMGAGPYKYVEFEQGVVRFERNGYYFKGCPNITTMLFKETADADKVSGTIAATFDVTDPSINEAAVTAIQQANDINVDKNPLEMSGAKIYTSLVDNLGYGYIGINADNVKVGDVKDSDASKNMRKAFATVFAVGREPAINSYYGPRATVINYPISNTSWAAPQPTDEGYALAFSVDVEGEAIFTAEMQQPQREEAAKAAAIGFLKAAGFTYDESTKKFIAAPAGAKLKYEIIVPGDGKGDHPAFAIITKAEEILDSIGITLDINDPADSNQLWNALEAHTQEMWTAAWGSTVDPDMYQVYHSSNVVGLEGSTESNHYGIEDAHLDELIMAARESADQAYRKGVYKECLDTIIEWGVEIPTYQRKNAVIFNNERVNMESITPDITTFWGWMNDIEGIEMKAIAG